MKKFGIVQAIYYDPKMGPEHGTDVTSELSAQIAHGRLFYNGIYNFILPDNFKRIPKKLKIVIEFSGKQHTKYYNENEKIDLPSDLGIESQKWWETSWVQVILVLGAIAGIIGLIVILR
ncbi:MAG TPA: hypothetical protein VMT23_00170 [Candidatus Binatia bacterium]|nr:hypothetical protein [Candidatus Binatia bacterium]